MADEFLSEDEKREIVIYLFVGCILLAACIWVGQIVVSAAKATANFVTMNIDRIVFGILLFIFLLELFKYLKYRYIGKAKGKGVDPLLTIVAKKVVKDKETIRDKTKIIQNLSRKFRIDEDRAELLFLQLEYSGVLKECDDSSYEVPLNSVWELHDIFAEINAESNYFKSKIEARIASIEESLSQQIDRETGEWQKRLLLALKSNISAEVALPYFNLLLKSGTSADVEKMAKEEISLYESKKKQISVTYNSNVIQSLLELYDDLSGNKIWNMGKRFNIQYCRYEQLDIGLKPFKEIFVNGKKYDSPHFKLNKEDLYLFPYFGILYKADFNAQSIKIIDYKDVSAEIQSREVSENSSLYVSEAEYSHTVWEHQRVDGGPDRRYSDNASEDFYKFYAVVVPELNLNLLCSKWSTAEKIWMDFMNVFKSAGS